MRGMAGVYKHFEYENLPGSLYGMQSEWDYSSRSYSVFNYRLGRTLRRSKRRRRPCWNMSVYKFSDYGGHPYSFYSYVEED